MVLIYKETECAHTHLIYPLLCTIVYDRENTCTVFTRLSYGPSSI